MPPGHVFPFDAYQHRGIVVFYVTTRAALGSDTSRSVCSHIGAELLLVVLGGAGAPGGSDGAGGGAGPQWPAGHVWTSSSEALMNDARLGRRSPVIRLRGTSGPPPPGARRRSPPLIPQSLTCPHSIPRPLFTTCKSQPKLYHRIIPLTPKVVLVHINWKRQGFVKYAPKITSLLTKPNRPSKSFTRRKQFIHHRRGVRIFEILL